MSKGSGFWGSRRFLDRIIALNWQIDRETFIVENLHKKYIINIKYLFCLRKQLLLAPWLRIGQTRHEQGIYVSNTILQKYWNYILCLGVIIKHSTLHFMHIVHILISISYKPHVLLDTVLTFKRNDSNSNYETQKELKF